MLNQQPGYGSPDGGRPLNSPFLAGPSCVGIARRKDVQEMEVQELEVQEVEVQKLEVQDLEVQKLEVQDLDLGGYSGHKRSLLVTCSVSVVVTQ